MTDRKTGTREEWLAAGPAGGHLKKGKFMYANGGSATRRGRPKGSRTPAAASIDSFSEPGSS
jgi:hypothetical protein